MILIYLSFNTYKLNLRFYDRWTVIQQHLVQSDFWVIFRTPILNSSYNRLKYIFEQNISISAIEIINLVIKINKNMKFYFIWEDLTHFSTVSLKLRQHEEAAYRILKEIHVFMIC